ncbi:hypothetical protein HLB03_05475 [Acidianus sp. DSM 29099]|nr:hypothetical protein [Acidianus sp. RZ1]
MTSVLDQKEFEDLRTFRGKVSKEEVKKILDLVEENILKGNSLKSAIIFAYTDYIEEVRGKKEVYSLISEILEKYSQKLGLENVSQLILNTLD